MSLFMDYTIDPREQGKTTYAVTVSRLVWQTTIVEVDAYDDDDAIDSANIAIGFKDTAWETDETIEMQYEIEVPG
jgi:hypothetical protein